MFRVFPHKRLEDGVMNEGRDRYCFFGLRLGDRLILTGIPAGYRIRGKYLGIGERIGPVIFPRTKLK